MGDGHVLTPEEISDQYGERLVVLTDEVEPVFGTPAQQAATLERYAGGKVWTQMDAENGDILYAKGWHLVNRTGVYAVVLPPSPEPLEDAAEGVVDNAMGGWLKTAISDLERTLDTYRSLLTTG